MESENPVRIALVVDERSVHQVVQAILRCSEFVVEDFNPCVDPESSGDCDLACAADSGPDVLLVEVLVPRCCSGIEVAQKALRHWPEVAVLLTSASPPWTWPAETAAQFSALPRERWAFLPKPFTASQLKGAIEQLLGR